MTSKSALAFQPAPRPQPRTSPEDAERLRVATQDLGFGRQTAAPAPRPAEVTHPPRPPSSASQGTSAAPVGAPAEPKRGPALKFDVTDELWDELRLKALRRRVTVKYLICEALAEKGYAVDLAAIPEDGRRLR